MLSRLHLIFFLVFLLITIQCFSQVGSVDPSFNVGTGSNFFVGPTAIQSDGKIIVGGDFNSFNGVPQQYIVRLNSDGSIDNSFTIGSSFVGLNGLSAIVIQNDGKILVGGDFWSYNGTSLNGIARLNIDGSVDTSFHIGTGVSTGVSPYFNHPVVYSIKIQTDGKILIGGIFTSYNGTPIELIARLNADGSLDTSFTTAFSLTNAIVSSTSISAIELQSDGKVIVAGRFYKYNNTDMNCIVRLNTDGSFDTSFDTSFGVTGGTVANIPNIVSTVAVQSDGKIIIGGDFQYYKTTRQNYLARLNPDGSLDANFNNGGMGLNVADANFVSCIHITCNGNIVITGEFISYNKIARISIARLHKDGSLDLNFNTLGLTQVVSLGSITEQNDGNLIIGGGNFVVNGYYPHIARLKCNHLNPSIDKIINSDTCFLDDTKFSFNDSFEYDSLLWNFNDPTSGLLNTSTVLNSTHQFTSSSVYTVTATAYYCNTLTTISKQLTINTKPTVDIGNDTILCVGDSLRINVDPIFTQYLWSDNSTNDFLIVDQTGKYWVQVLKNGCSNSDSINVDFINYPLVNIGNDTTLCIGDSLKITVDSGFNYLWSDNSINNTISIKSQGQYWVKVANHDCVTSDTLNINFVNRPSINLGPDTILCKMDSLILTVNPGFNYLWSNTDTTNSINIKYPGEFWCRISDGGCKNSDSIQVSVVNYPTIELGSDTVFCTANSYILNPNNNEIATYLWSNGSTQSSLTINTSGEYWVSVSNDHCLNSDTIDIIFDEYKNLIASASKDTVGYLESIQFLATGSNFSSYTWNFNDGVISPDQNSNHTFTSSGRHTVVVQATDSNNCIVAKEVTIIVKEILFIPNLFTPNNDSSNDSFEIIYNGNEPFTLKIFNQWGSQIFSSIEKTNIWNGSNVSDGIYYYELHLGSKKYVGWVQILR